MRIGYFDMRGNLAECLEPLDLPMNSGDALVWESVTSFQYSHSHYSCGAPHPCGLVWDCSLKGEP